MASNTKCHQVLGSVIAQSASRLNVMDLKILHAPAPLTTPSVSLQDFPAELAISFRVKSQTWPVGSDPRQSVTCTSSRSCFLCGFGRPMTSRVRQDNRASRFSVSKLILDLILRYNSANLREFKQLLDALKCVRKIKENF